MSSKSIHDAELKEHLEQKLLILNSNLNKFATKKKIKPSYKLPKPQTTKTKSYIKKEKKIQPFSCGSCEKRFATQKTLNTHMEKNQVGN